METKKRRIKRSPESYIKEVSELTNGEYSVLGSFKGTARKITHRHNTCGHEWDVTPNNFLYSGSRCPKCGMKGRKPKVTDESFRQRVFDLVGDEYTFLEEYTKAITKTKVRHNVCGLEYEVRPSSFLSGARCPACAHANTTGKGVKINHEMFCARVYTAVGDEYSVLSLYGGSRVKVRMKHNLCGKEYEVRPDVFLGGARCVGCTHKLRTRFEDSIGDSYELLEDVRFITDKAHVKHRECGREFTAQLSGLVNGVTGCPHCANLYMMSDVEFRKRVYDLVGEEYVFQEPFVNMRTHIEVKHVSCGHSYKVNPSAFLSGKGCANCVVSKGEECVKESLNSIGVEYDREKVFHYLGRNRFDFFIPSLNIAIEYDGEQHYKSIDAWGGEEYLESVRQSDALKNDFCEYMGIDLLRIPYWEFDNIDEIVTNFIDTVKLMRSISASGSEMSKCR